jgi:hypothetical protein
MVHASQAEAQARLPYWPDALLGAPLVAPHNPQCAYD